MDLGDWSMLGKYFAAHTGPTHYYSMSLSVVGDGGGSSVEDTGKESNGFLGCSCLVNGRHVGVILQLLLKSPDLALQLLHLLHTVLVAGLHSVPAQLQFLLPSYQPLLHLGLSSCSQGLL